MSDHHYCQELSNKFMRSIERELSRILRPEIRKSCGCRPSYLFISFDAIFKFIRPYRQISRRFKLLGLPQLQDHIYVVISVGGPTMVDLEYTAESIIADNIDEYNYAASCRTRSFNRKSTIANEIIDGITVPKARYIIPAPHSISIGTAEWTLRLVSSWTLDSYRGSNYGFYREIVMAIPLTPVISARERIRTLERLHRNCTSLFNMLPRDVVKIIKGLLIALYSDNQV